MYPVPVHMTICVAVAIDNLIVVLGEIMQPECIVGVGGTY